MELQNSPRTTALVTFMKNILLGMGGSTQFRGEITHDLRVK